ncbi:MAG TPA: MFS transporter [Pseudonocardiaceae bacterium]|jgi:predicted MFS family arabinose efflux permease
MTTPAGLVERLRAAVGGGARLRVVALLAGVLGLSAADSATVGAVAAELKTAFGVGNAAIGLLVTASVGVGALATLPFGVLIDKVNRTQLLSIMILLWCAAMLACGAAVSYPMLLACRLGLSVVVAAAFPAVASLLGDLFPATERGRIYGFVLAGELVGAAAGLLITGDIAAVVFMHERFGLPQAAATSLTVALGAGSIAGVLTAGRLSDHLLAHHRISAPPLVAGSAFLLAVAAFLAALFTPVFIIAAPLLFLGAAGLGAANPPLDAARLDIVHFRLWGRAESVRTVLRSAFVAIAPLLFGYLSARWDTHPPPVPPGCNAPFS